MPIVGGFQSIDAVSFDVGGTLIAPWPSVGHVYAEVAQEHSLPAFSPEALNLRFHTAWKDQAGFDYSRNAWLGVVKQTFHNLCPAEQVETFFPRLYARFTEPRCWTIYSDVLPTLESLRRRGLKLGILSNWDERLGPLLGALGLENYFDSVTISVQEGVQKPSALLFQRCCGRLGVSPERVLHVGDSQREDVEGALNAGLQALRIDRAQPSTSMPHVIQTLLAL